MNATHSQNHVDHRPTEPWRPAKPETVGASSSRSGTELAGRGAAAIPSKNPKSASPRKKRTPANGTRFIFYANPTVTLICMSQAALKPQSLMSAAQLTGVHPEMLLYYCRLGLLGQQRSTDSNEPSFDAEALHKVRRIEHYRRHLGISRRSLPLIFGLWHNGEFLNIELAFMPPPISEAALEQSPWIQKSLGPVTADPFVRT
jgi:hypothetical protein